MSGLFIVFEGGEGAGKSTQACALSDRLRAAGYGVLCTREPGGTPAAECVRKVLLQGDAQDFDAGFETFLFAAARYHHVKHCIQPALAAEKVVICDRFVDSTRIYQGVGSNVRMTLIDQLETAATNGVVSDLTFVLDIDPRIGLDRAGDTPDRFESQDLVWHDKVRHGFLDLAARDPGRYHVLDATAPADAMAKAIATVVLAHLENNLLKDYN